MKIIRAHIIGLLSSQVAKLWQTFQDFTYVSAAQSSHHGVLKQHLPIVWAVLPIHCQKQFHNRLHSSDQNQDSAVIEALM